MLEAAVKGLDEGAVRWLAGSADVQLLLVVRLLIQCREVSFAP